MAFALIAIRGQTSDATRYQLFHVFTGLPAVSRVMPGVINIGAIRGLWQAMFIRGLDSPIFWGYPAVLAILRDGSLDVEQKLERFMAVQYDLMKKAAIVLGDPISENRYRAGCETAYDRNSVRHDVDYVSPGSVDTAYIFYWDQFPTGQQPPGEWKPFPFLWKDTPNLYQVMGVSPGCTSQEVRAARSRLLRTCHPDKLAGQLHRIGFLASLVPKPDYTMPRHEYTAQIMQCIWAYVAIAGLVPYVAGLEHIGGMGFDLPSITPNDAGDASGLQQFTAFVLVQWGYTMADQNVPDDEEEYLFGISAKQNTESAHQRAVRHVADGKARIGNFKTSDPQWCRSKHATYRCLCTCTSTLLLTLLRPTHTPIPTRNTLHSSFGSILPLTNPASATSFIPSSLNLISSDALMRCPLL